IYMLRSDNVIRLHSRPPQSSDSMLMNYDFCTRWAIERDVKQRTYRLKVDWDGVLESQSVSKSTQQSLFLETSAGFVRRQLTSRTTKFPTAEIGAAAGSRSFFIGSISSETSAPTTSSPAERKNGS